MDVFVCKLAFFLLIFANYESHGALISYTRPEVSELDVLKNYFESLDAAKKSLEDLIFKWFTDSSDEIESKAESDKLELGKNSFIFIEFLLSNFNPLLLQKETN